MFKREYNINVNSRLNRVYAIEQETEVSSIRVYDETSWIIFVAKFDNEQELKDKLQIAIDEYETKTIGKKFLDEVNNWTFNYKDGVVSINEETFIFSGKQARIVNDFWGDMDIRKTVKDSTIYLTDNDNEYVIRNDKDIINYLYGNVEKLRIAKSIYVY